ncbi:serine/threonine-protein kinase [Micromonospora sp. NPDC023956]|uniref:serine/threonine-protein kinase n=1 Tax=Micromonospora sp. NPDC023956 TaxID=3155722 RepID=UPI003409D617
MTSPDADPAGQPTLPPTMPTAAPAPPAVQAVALGSRYVMDRPIGEGAHGRVWRGRRLVDDAPVAIKTLREEYAAEPAAVARFLRERNVLRALRHPHLVPVHDLVVEGDTLAIVMDLVTGENLRVAAGRGAFDRHRALTVLAQVAAALAAVHSAGIVHRDVKPENVLITWRGGEPWSRLTDFGVAQVADGQTLTQHGHTVGTPAYLAPELALGRTATAAVDVYALGVLGYELLAGRRPFASEHPLGLLRAHIEDEPVRPDELAEPLWHLLRQCLAKRPEDRPDPTRLAERLTALGAPAGTLPVDAPPPLPPVPGTTGAGQPAWRFEPTPVAALGPPDPENFRPDPDAGTTPASRTGTDAPAVPTGADRTGTGSTGADRTGTPSTGAASTGAGSSGAASAGTASTGSTASSGAASTGTASSGAVRSAGAVEVLATTGATVPVPEPARTEPVKRRRWLAPAAGLAVLALVSAGVGVWLGRPDDDPRPAPPVVAAPTGPAAQLYPLPVTASSPRAGTVRLDFGDQSKLPGFDSYVIWRDDTKIGQVTAGKVPPYLIPGVDRRTRHCYRVWALVVTDRQPPAPAEPACLTADGRQSARDPG